MQDTLYWQPSFIEYWLFWQSVIYHTREYPIILKQIIYNSYKVSVQFKRLQFSIQNTSTPRPYPSQPNRTGGGRRRPQVAEPREGREERPLRWHNLRVPC